LSHISRKIIHCISTEQYFTVGKLDITSASAWQAKTQAIRRHAAFKFYDFGEFRTDPYHHQRIFSLSESLQSHIIFFDTGTGRTFLVTQVVQGFNPVDLEILKINFLRYFA
jgi:hypothetical protein